ncbi:hypothetical protein VTL71DRAFT_14185 [Oculimacula yallundae]|uniref:Uncharacterized protein n=1 Tax=Oculimacula yallundae TaxID=86028 RepID=A0ABR4CHQ9_9HELO
MTRRAYASRWMDRIEVNTPTKTPSKPKYDSKPVLSTSISKSVSLSPSRLFLQQKEYRQVGSGIRRLCEISQEVIAIVGVLQRFFYGVK